MALSVPDIELELKKLIDADDSNSLLLGQLARQYRYYRQLRSLKPLIQKLTSRQQELLGCGGMFGAGLATRVVIEEVDTAAGPKKRLVRREPQHDRSIKNSRAAQQAQAQTRLQGRRSSLHSGTSVTGDDDEGSYASSDRHGQSHRPNFLDRNGGTGSPFTLNNQGQFSSHHSSAQHQWGVSERPVRTEASMGGVGSHVGRGSLGTAFMNTSVPTPAGQSPAWPHTPGLALPSGGGGSARFFSPRSQRALQQLGVSPPGVLPPSMRSGGPSFASPPTGYGAMGAPLVSSRPSTPAYRGNPLTLGAMLGSAGPGLRPTTANRFTPTLSAAAGVSNFTSPPTPRVPWFTNTNGGQMDDTNLTSKMQHVPQDSWMAGRSGDTGTPMLAGRQSSYDTTGSNMAASSVRTPGINFAEHVVRSAGRKSLPGSHGGSGGVGAQTMSVQMRQELSRLSFKPSTAAKRKRGLLVDGYMEISDAAAMDAMKSANITEQKLSAMADAVRNLFPKIIQTEIFAALTRNTSELVQDKGVPQAFLTGSIPAWAPTANPPLQAVSVDQVTAVPWSQNEVFLSDKRPEVNLWQERALILKFLRPAGLEARWTETVARRLSVLQSSCMGPYNWDGSKDGSTAERGGLGGGGGDEGYQSRDEGQDSGGDAGGASELVSDSVLLFHVFCCYMDKLWGDKTGTTSPFRDQCVVNSARLPPDYVRRFGKSIKLQVVRRGPKLHLRVLCREMGIEIREGTHNLFEAIAMLLHCVHEQKVKDILDGVDLKSLISEVMTAANRDL